MIPVPPAVGPMVETLIVSFLSVELVDKLMLEPAVKVRESVADPATMSF